MKIGLEKNNPNIATLSAVGSVYESAFPPTHGYLHQMTFDGHRYSGWISVPNAGIIMNFIILLPLRTTYIFRYIFPQISVSIPIFIWQITIKQIFLHYFRE